MVHEVVVQSVSIKTTIFEEPVKLINFMELTAAVGMACRQAGLPKPSAPLGEDIRTFRDRALAELSGQEKVNPKLMQVIQTYIFKHGEVINEDAQITLELGYGFSQ